MIARYIKDNDWDKFLAQKEEEAYPFNEAQKLKSHQSKKHKKVKK